MPHGESLESAARKLKSIQSFIQQTLDSSSLPEPESNVRFGTSVQDVNSQSLTSLGSMRKQARDSMKKLIISINNPDELENEIRCMHEFLEGGLRWKRARLESFDHVKTTFPDPDPALPLQVQHSRATKTTPLSPARQTKYSTQTGTSGNTSGPHDVQAVQADSWAVDSEKPPRQLSENISFEDAIEGAQITKGGSPAIAEVDGFIRVRNAVLRKATETGTRAWSSTTSSTLGLDKVDKYIVFWARVFGKEGIRRLTAFMKLVRSVSRWAVDHLDSMPVPEAMGSQPAIVKSVIHAYHLQSSTHAAAITTNETSTGQLFERLKLGTSVGRSYTSLVNDYLLHCLHGFPLNVDLDANDPLYEVRERARTRLRNEIALSRSYHTVSNVFGPGIWTLLPAQDFASFKRWKGKYLAWVVESLAEEIPDTVDVSQHIGGAVIEPLLNRQRPRSLCIEGNDASRLNLTLLDLVAEAEDTDQLHEDDQFPKQNEVVMQES